VPCTESTESRDRGGPADTTAAVYGQLAGAVYGEHGIPGSWRAKLACRQLIESYADRLASASFGLELHRAMKDIEYTKECSK